VLNVGGRFDLARHVRMIRAAHIQVKWKSLTADSTIVYGFIDRN
jgi:hypothetical protein